MAVSDVDDVEKKTYLCGKCHFIGEKIKGRCASCGSIISKKVKPFEQGKPTIKTADICRENPDFEKYKLTP